MALTQEQKGTILWTLLFISAIAEFGQSKFAHELMIHSQPTTLTQIVEHAPIGAQKQ